MRSLFIAAVICTLAVCVQAQIGRNEQGGVGLGPDTASKWGMYSERQIERSYQSAVVSMLISLFSIDFFCVAENWAGYETVNTTHHM